MQIDIPFNLGYNSYKLLRTDSTLFFNMRLFSRNSHRDLFSVTSNTCFFYKIGKSISTLYQGFFQPMENFCKMPLTNHSN